MRCQGFDFWASVFYTIVFNSRAGPILGSLTLNPSMAHLLNGPNNFSQPGLRTKTLGPSRGQIGLGWVWASPVHEHPYEGVPYPSGRALFGPTFWISAVSFTLLSSHDPTSMVYTLISPWSSINIRFYDHQTFSQQSSKSKYNLWLIWNSLALLHA